MSNGFIYKVINARNNKKYGTKTARTKANIKRNMAHINYIATRPGAELGENGHALVGYISGIEDVEKANLYDIAKIVGDDTKKGIKVWQTVISLSEDEAVKNDLTNKQNWNDLIRKKITVIAKEYNIDYKNLNYVVAYHNEEGHPHIHLVFWDKEGKNKIENMRVRYGKIRGELSKEIHQEELQKLYDIKNKEKKEIKEHFISFVEEEKLKENIKMIAPHLLNQKVIDKKLRKSKVKELIINIEKIKTKDISSFKYQYLKPEEKEEIDNISKQILKASPECNKSYMKYIEAHTNSKSLLNDNVKYLKREKEKAEQEITNIMGNQVLKFIKELKKEEIDNDIKNFERQTENQKQYRIGNFINEINSILAQLSEAEEIKTRKERQMVNKELSKQAKKELAIKLQNKSNIDWSM